MIVVLSGEGPSDLGTCNNAQGMCRKPEFVHGPMTVLVDKEIECHLRYSMLDVTPERYIYLSEERLRELEQQRKQNRRSVSLVGKKQAQETGYFYINAWMLGEEAQRLALAEEDRAIAVLFRDCDGTRSAAASLWQDKWQSMRNGFDRSPLGLRGVPMLPKPKSEAWLLCAVQNNYQHCQPLEDLSGNDAVAGSAKALLDHAMHGNASTQEQVTWLADNGFDHAAVASMMPSYNQFKQSMAAAMAAV